jgi:glycosyltransferase involved in cell wall biosynthesis
MVLLAGRLAPAGGVESYVFHYCRAAKDLGVSLDLIVTTKNVPRPIVQELTQRGVRVHEFDVSGSKRKQAMGYLRCLFYLRRVHRGCELFYSQAISGFALWAHKALKPRVWVHHHHGDITRENYHTFPRRYQTVFRQADHVIACTPPQRDVIDEVFHRGGRTTFLPYLKSEGTPSATPKPLDNPCVVGFFGLIRTGKGVPFLLQQAAWLRENGFRLELHGPDVEGLLKDPLPAGVTWHGGYSTDADLDQRLRSVDVLAMPSLGGEGLPLVLCEAISRGVPVVAFDGGGLRDVREFHPGLTVTAPTESDFRNALLTMRQRLITHPALGMDLAREYREKLGNAIPLAWWKDFLKGVPR